MSSSKLDIDETAENVDDKRGFLNSDDNNVGEIGNNGNGDDDDVELQVLEHNSSNQPQLTVRAVVVGTLVGGALCCSNMFFGLKSGWTSMGSIQSAIIGFGIFRILERAGIGGFTPHENVVVQTCGVAAASMALAGGFVGPLNSIETQLKISFSVPVLLLWCLGLAHFGAFLAVPLRKQTILIEKLKFPSGTATAITINAMHASTKVNQGRTDQSLARVLLISMLVGFFVKTLTYFFPATENLPIFTWIGLPIVTELNWTLYPSLGHVGQGMIMGLKTTNSMMLGALVGWAMLGPIARAQGWAPGSVGSMSDGIRGWCTWLAVLVMTAESFISLMIVVHSLLRSFIKFRRKKSGDNLSKENEDVDADPAPINEQVPLWWWVTGLCLSSALCTVIVTVIFKIPVIQPIVGTLLAIVLSVIGVRALGETDLNPVSGIGKISQIVFAGLAPGQIVSNLLGGAIAEAGALQAGDMMQDLKTGHLLRASPRAQFLGQCISVFFSIFFAVGSYKLFTSVYEIPGPEFSVPSASMWSAMASLLQQGISVLPHNLLVCGLPMVIITIIISIVPVFLPKAEHFLPSMMAVGIGMYVEPHYSISRWIGSVLLFLWMKYEERNRHASSPSSSSAASKFYIPIASGLVAGEGMAGLTNAILKAMGCRYSCVGCTSGFSCGRCGVAGGSGNLLFGLALVGMGIIALSVMFILKRLGKGN